MRSLILETSRMPRLALLAAAGAASLLAPTLACANTPFLLPSLFSTQQNHMSVIAGQALEAYFVPSAAAMKGASYTVIGPDGASGQPEKVTELTDLTVVELSLPATGTYRLTTGEWVTRTTRLAKIDGAWKMIRPARQPGRGGQGGARPAGGEGPRPAGAGGAQAGAAAGAPPRPVNNRFVEEAAVPAGAETMETQAVSIADVYISRGAPNDTAFKPTGKGLELIPLHNPDDLFDGDTAGFKLTFDGKAAAGAPVIVHRQGNNYEEKGVLAEGETGADGVYKLQFKPGVYSIQFAWPAGGPAEPGAAPATKSYIYTLTFEVSR
jgi:hypothetical protein